MRPLSALEFVLGPDAYLELVLARYLSNCTPFLVQILQGIVEPPIRKWAGPHLREITVSGSNAKGTAIAGQADVDFFVSVSHEVSETLSQIYWTLFQRLQDEGWSPRAQNVSIGILVMNYHVDIVPARVQAGYGIRHSLYRRKQDSWTQTNITANVNLVRNSRRTEEIRLTKIWRELNGLEFPSFALELAVLSATHKRRIGALADNFWEVLRYLSEEFPFVRLVDPENTANIVSDDLTQNEKSAIARAARGAREQEHWEDIVW